jgi:hypothetical protein
MQKGDIAEKCGCPDDELMTEEEYDLAEGWRQEFVRKMLP